MLCYAGYTMWSELFGVVTADVFNQSNQAHAVNYVALAHLLTDKGLISCEELEVARAKATHFVEQEFARKREEQKREYAEKHPELAKLVTQIADSDLPA